MNNTPPSASIFRLEASTLARVIQTLQRNLSLGTGSRAGQYGWHPNLIHELRSSEVDAAGTFGLHIRGASLPYRDVDLAASAMFEPSSIPSGYGRSGMVCGTSVVINHVAVPTHLRGREGHLTERLAFLEKASWALTPTTRVSLIALPPSWWRKQRREYDQGSAQLRNAATSEWWACERSKDKVAAYVSLGILPNAARKLEIQDLPWSEPLGTNWQGSELATLVHLGAVAK